MNGSLGGDLSGLENGLLPPHQSYSQPESGHYHVSHSLPMSSSGLYTAATPTNSVACVQQQANNSTLSRFMDNSSLNTTLVGYGLKLHNSVGVHPIIPQPSSDHPSPVLRSTSTPSSGTTSPHPHSAHTPTTSGGPSLPHPDAPETTASNASSLLSQMNQLGPSERCTPSQAVSMGQQLLAIIAQQERSKMPLPNELQNSFDVFHRCLAVVYGTFFLNLYSKANAPCLLCHGCKSLYPPGQFIHHPCPTLPPNILPCRSRMWRRCLVPLVSQGMDKLQQKQRWKYVLEKFSHTAAAVAGRRNPIPPEIEAQLLEMPELKRGRFVEEPSKQKRSEEDNSVNTNATENSLSCGVVKDLNSSLVSGMVDAGKLYRPLANLDGETTKEDSNNSPNTAQSLLDIEPNEYDLEESSSPSDNQGQSSLRGSADSGVGERSLLPGNGSSVLSLSEQLVSEVRSLQQQLALAQAKLKTATEMIEKMPSEACMREQLAQALSTQQTLMVERDQAREQLKLSQDRNNRLQKQLDTIRTAFGNMEKYFHM